MNKEDMLHMLKSYSSMSKHEYGRRPKLDIAIEWLLKEYDRLTKENLALGKGQHTLMMSRRKWKHKYYKVKKENKNLLKGEKHD